MRKVISIMLTLVMLLSVVQIPAVQAAENTKPLNMINYTYDGAELLYGEQHAFLTATNFRRPRMDMFVDGGETRIFTKTGADAAIVQATRISPLTPQAYIKDKDTSGITQSLTAIAR